MNYLSNNNPKGPPSPKRPVSSTPTTGSSGGRGGGNIARLNQTTPIRNGNNTATPVSVTRPAANNLDTEFEGGFTGTSNFLEEFVNQAIRNYDKMVQKRLRELDSAVFNEIDLLSRRLSDMEAVVASVKQDAASSARVIEALVDLGKSSKLNPHGTNGRMKSAVKGKSPIASLAEGSVRLSSDSRSVQIGSRSTYTRHAPHPPGSPRPSGGQSVSQERDRGGYFDDEIGYGSQVESKNQSLDPWNENIGGDARGRAISPERTEDEATTQAWSKFEELVSNMGLNISTRMSTLETELGECRNLFGQVSLAAEKLTQASNQLTFSAHTPYQFPFANGGLDGRPISTNIHEGYSSRGGAGYGVIPMYSVPPSAASSDAFGYARHPVETVTSPHLKESVNHQTPVAANDHGRMASSSGKNGRPDGAADEIQGQIAELEAKVKSLSKEKTKARQSIKLWVDQNSKEGQEPTDTQREDAKRLFQTHVQVCLFSIPLVV
jgi:prefoldin subunit 5